METSRIPNKLKKYRRQSGYSQKKVARILGFADTSTLSRWEHGITFPGIVQVFRLARLYHTQPEQMFDELWESITSEKSLLAQEESLNTSQKFYL